jgi:hypothetical protein
MTASTAFQGMLADRILKQTDDSSFVVEDESGTLGPYIGRAADIANAAIGRAVITANVALPIRLAGFHPAADLVRTMMDAQTTSLVINAVPSIIGTAASVRAFEITHSLPVIQDHLAAPEYFALASNATPHPIGLNWLSEATVSLQDLLSGFDGEASEKEKLYALGEEVLIACAGSQEPAIDLDHEGNVEFYFKEQAEGLLLVIKHDGALHIFGNSAGESWRSLYPLSGHIWRHRLQVYLAPFKQHA